MTSSMLNVGRLSMDGIPQCDLQAAESLEDGQWFAFWGARGDEYARLGAEALERGHRRTAGQLTWLGSLCWQYAQYLWHHEPERREAGQRRKVELYDLAAPNLDPPAERVNVPIDDTEIPGFLRVPAARREDERVPLAVLLGGLESTKEESYTFENELLTRGIATYAFDGPGQGEMFFSVKLRPDFERYTSAVLDHLLERSEVDPERVSVVGRSLGGHYALKSASADPRFAACVSWGGFFDMADWDNRGILARETYRYVSGAGDLEEAKRIAQASLDCAPVIDGLRCPTLHHHGGLDVIQLDQIDRLRAGAVNAALDIIVEPEGDHCCHNLGPRARFAMIDWLGEKLVAVAV